MMYDREDLYDQNLILKINIGECKEENKVVKTKL